MKRKPWERTRSATQFPCDEPGCHLPWVMRFQENYGPWRHMCKDHARAMVEREKEAANGG